MFLLSAIKQSLAKTRMLERRGRMDSFAKTVLPLTDAKARDYFSVAERVRAATCVSGEPPERLPGVFERPSFLEIV